MSLPASDVSAASPADRCCFASPVIVGFRSRLPDGSSATASRFGRRWTAAARFCWASVRTRLPSDCASGIWTFSPSAQIDTERGAAEREQAEVGSPHAPAGPRAHCCGGREPPEVPAPDAELPYYCVMTISSNLIKAPTHTRTRTHTYTHPHTRTHTPTHIILNILVITVEMRRDLNVFYKNKTVFISLFILYYLL